MCAFAFIHLLECIVVYREIYNGKRWRTDQLYKAPMGEVGDLRVFLNDFLYFTHPEFGCSIGKVRHFFCKVHIYVVCHVVHTCHTHVYILVNIHPLLYTA